MKNQYLIAQKIKDIPINFDNFLSLEPLSNGKPNPFYVDYPHVAISRLKDTLINDDFTFPPKFYFWGHLGCGKSTELLRLARDKDINQKYEVVYIDLKKLTADDGELSNFNFQDVLLLIGSSLQNAYIKKHGQLSKGFEKELDKWKGEIVKEIIQKTAFEEFSISGGLDAIFAKFQVAAKVNPDYSVEIKQILNANFGGLIDVINQIINAISKKSDKQPLVIFDDLEKIKFEQAKEIFFDKRDIIQKPNCPIIYTVDSSMFYDGRLFEAIRDRAHNLTNVIIATKNGDHVEDGRQIFRQFVYKRMNHELIDGEALDMAIEHGGGVFRETGRIIRESALSARQENADKINVKHVELAINDLRKQYKRILSSADWQLMKQIDKNKRLEWHENLMTLLKNLAIIEYSNGDIWCDVHPVLRNLLPKE